ncbi:unnamed protein product [Periconia digitata]|uniref:CFEM domain-containing protein n=1 Tax=Periconia digitata TaxID=1303443 RepID=A0A9W4XHE2_9PLEO|nr:unnamed protein product [Periconia digitata]
MASLRLLLLLLFALCATSLAQSSSLPSCAQQCLKSAFGTQTCAPTNQTCICTNPVFQQNVTLCVSASCTIPEALATRNISLANCGVPLRNHGQDYAVLSNVMISVAGAFVIMRFAFKGIVSRSDFGYDDWCVLATAICGIPSALVTVYGTVAHGLGQDIWALSPHEITEMLRSFYTMAILYFLEVALLKLTLIMFYIRVFPIKSAQWVLWGTTIFTVGWGIAFVITAIFQCQPISYFWKRWDGLHEGKCLDINAITASHASISIALDFWILAIPLWQLYGLQMSWKRKVSVALMFCVGTFVTIVSILRLKALVHFAKSDNASWEFYDVSVWSSIEICVGIMCACLPTVRLFLVKMFPILGGSSARKSNKYYHYGSGNELGNLSQRKNTYKANSNVSSPHSGVFEAGDGVTVEHSFAIEYGRKEADETSLVSHKGKSSQ